MVRRIIVFIAIIISALGAYAQQGLHVNEIFTGKIVPLRHGVEIKIKGKAVSKYKLSYYHSFKFVASQQQSEEMKELISRDSPVQEWKNRQGKKLTRIVQFAPADKHNRFLCYLSQEKKSGIEVTVIYMEGWAKDIFEPRNLIK